MAEAAAAVGEAKSSSDEINKSDGDKEEKSASGAESDREKVMHAKTERSVSDSEKDERWPVIRNPPTVREVRKRRVTLSVQQRILKKQAGIKSMDQANFRTLEGTEHVAKEGLLRHAQLRKLAKLKKE